MASHDELKNPNPRGRILEYAEFIEDQVARARSRIKSNDMFRAILWMITVSLGVIFLEVILDHTVELPSMARRLILFGGLGTAAVYAFVRIARPMLLKVNTLYAAKSIESTDSTFKNSLINYLQIRDDADKVAPSVLAQIEARAVADLSKVNVDDVVDQSQIVRLSYALAAIVVGICLYSWLTPKSLLDSARRAFLADVQRPTNTRFLNITPGDKPDAPKVMTGMPVEFSVETLGAQPEAVTLFTSRDEGKTFAETPMTVGNSFADPWKAKIDRVPGKLFYYMAGGDGKTRTYELEVLPVAIVEKVSLDYDFPEYAQAPRREGVEEGNVEALQGTRITITAFTNQPARSGTLDFGPRPPVPLIPVQGDQKKLTGTFLVDTDGQYSVKFNTVDGQANPEPVLYDIRVVKDVAPTARFIRPESPTLRPANARVPLVIEASDDFGLKEVKLHVHKNGEILQKAVDLIEPNAKEVSKQIQKTVALDLEPLSLKVGDKIEYWLTLRDNCDLQPNKFETPKQTIEIQEPVSQPKREELAQNEMAQAREDTGDQNPMDNPPDQGDKSEQNANEKSGDQQNDPQKQGEKKQDQQKQSEVQKKDGQGKGSQGDQSEAADPSDNAKEGGKQSQGKQQKSSPSSKSDSKTKNSQKNQSGQAGDQNDQDPSEKQDDSQKQNGAGKSSASKSGKQKNQGSQKSDPMKNEGDGSENAQEKQEPGDQGKQKSQTDQKKPGEEKSEPDPNGQNKASEKNQNKSGAEKGGSEKKQGGEKSDPSDSEKKQAGEKSDPSGTEKKQAGDSGEDGLPKGEPKAEDGSGEKGDTKSSKELSKQDRDKLNKLRDALGLNDKPQDAGEKGEGEEKAGSEKDGQEKMSEAGDQSKESAKSGQEKGQPGKQKSKSGQEKGKPGDSGKESAESGQEKGQEKGKPGDSGKESAESGQEKGQEKGKPGDSGKESAEPGDKAGDEKGSDKGEPGAEPKDSGKAGDEKGQAGQEKGQPKDSSKSAGEKGEQPDGESKKAGKDGVEKGSPKNQSKQAGNEKAKAGEEAGKEKGQGQPKAAQEKGDQPGEQGKDAQKGDKGKDAQKGDKPGEQGKDAQKGDKPGEQGTDAQKGDKPGEQGKDAQKGDKPGDESGKSEKPGEENGKPGPLTDAPPKAGGMREGTETPAPKPDESTPSPRAVEPDQPEPNENLTPDQKADQRLLKRLREMVDKNEISKDLEDSTGLSREEIDQFVRKFEAPPKEERKAAEGDGTTEVTSTPGKDSENRKVSLPGNLPGGQVTSRSNRGAGMVADDGSQGNLEGARARIPSALRSRFEAYQKGLSRANPRGAGTTNSGESRPANKNGDQPGSGSDR